MTKITAAPWSPTIRCRVWEDVLERVLPDRSVRDYLQRTNIFFPWAPKETEDEQRKRQHVRSRAERRRRASRPPEEEKITVIKSDRY